MSQVLVGNKFFSRPTFCLRLSVRAYKDLSPKSLQPCTGPHMFARHPGDDLAPLGDPQNMENTSLATPWLPLLGIGEIRQAETEMESEG